MWKKNKLTICFWVFIREIWSLNSCFDDSDWLIFSCFSWRLFEKADCFSLSEWTSRSTWVTSFLSFRIDRWTSFIFFWKFPFVGAFQALKISELFIRILGSGWTCQIPTFGEFNYYRPVNDELAETSAISLFRVLFEGVFFWSQN